MKIMILNNKKEIFVDIFYIVINAIMSILMFLPIYKDRATLPGFDDEGNEIVLNFFYDRTPLERLEEINIQWMLYLGIAMFLFV